MRGSNRRASARRRGARAGWKGDCCSVVDDGRSALESVWWRSDDESARVIATRRASGGCSHRWAVVTYIGPYLHVIARRGTREAAIRAAETWADGRPVRW